MNRRHFLKKIGKMAVLLASASAFPGLVLSGEAKYRDAYEFALPTGEANNETNDAGANPYVHVWGANFR